MTETKQVSEAIVRILPQSEQTPEMQQWVESNLANGNTPSEMLNYCKQAFGVMDSQIKFCEREIANIGVKLDAHIAYTDQKLSAVNSEIAELRQKIAVTEAVSNTRAEMQQFMMKGVMDAQNATNQNVANVATKSNKSLVYPDPTYWLIGAVIIFVLFTFVKVRVEKEPVQQQPQPVKAVRAENGRNYPSTY